MPRSHAFQVPSRTRAARRGALAALVPALAALCACAGCGRPQEEPGSAEGAGDERDERDEGYGGAELQAAALQRDLAALDALVAQAPEAPRAEVERALGALLAGRPEPHFREAYERAESRIHDRYAEARARTLGRADPAPSDASSEDARTPDAIDAARAEALLALADDARVDDTASGRSAPTAPERAADAPLVSEEDEDWRAIVARLSTPEELVAWAEDAEFDSRVVPARAAAERAVAPGADEASRARAAHVLARTGARLVLRRELVAAAVPRASALHDMGVLRVFEEGLRFDGVRGVVPWHELGPPDWSALGESAALSPQARLGLALELFGCGDEAGAERLLARLLAESAVDAAAVDDALAWYRDEPVPADGYALEGGRFRPRELVQAEEDRRRGERAGRRLERASGMRRDAAYAELLALARRDLLASGIAARWKVVGERWHAQRQRSALEGLAEERRALDELRAHALRVVEEGELEALSPTQQAAIVRAFQTDLTEMRRRIAASHPVQLGEGTRSIAAEVQWLAAREEELELATARPAGLPDWLLALDAEAPRVDLLAWTWNAAERADRRRDRAVLAANAALTPRTRPQTPNDPRPDAEELLQVALANELRQVVGRSALAWNARLQGAAWDHAEYMSRTGDFGHTEPAPDRANPTARMARRGYPAAGGENCYSGSTNAAQVHAEWIRSLGHLRNLVAAGNTEMASALVGTYWTQVFGADTAFLKSLPAWSD